MYLGLFLNWHQGSLWHRAQGTQGGSVSASPVCFLQLGGFRGNFQGLDCSVQSPTGLGRLALVGTQGPGVPGGGGGAEKMEECMGRF